LPPGAKITDYCAIHGDDRKPSLTHSLEGTRRMKYGFARVSTDDQNADMQHAALKKDRCKKIFTDTLPGVTTKRPALLRCLKTLKRGDSWTG
jgi:predicted site-specific integrase-resolvase